MRIINRAHFLAHTNPFFKKEKILKVNDIFQLQCFNFYFKLCKKRIPCKIMRYFQNENNPENNLKLKFFDCQDEYGKKRIRYSLQHLINNTPALITDKVFTHSFLGYKNNIKRYF